MKNLSIVIVGAIVLAACATPKYSYHFDRYDYNSGKKAKQAEAILVAETSQPPETLPEPVEAANEPVAESPLILTAEPVASAGQGMGKSVSAVDKGVFGKKYAEMSKHERREFRKTLKTEVRNFVKNRKKADNGATIQATQVMDHDLKLAVIFGAVAITLSFFGGVNSVFWILSVVSLVIAVVFFIKWIAEQ